MTTPLEQIKERLELMKDKLPKGSENWLLGSVRNDTISEVQSILPSIIQEVVEAEWRRCIDVLDHDHTRCPIKETCIGYGNAQSDLMNNPPPSSLKEESKKEEPLPCPHGRMPMGGQDGWKHCPHCLGLNRRI